MVFFAQIEFFIGLAACTVVAVIALLWWITRQELTRIRKEQADRKCAGCGVHLAVDYSGILCLRCMSVLSHHGNTGSPSDDAGASVPMIPSLGPQTAQGIQAGAPSPIGMETPDVAPTAEFACP